MGVKAVGVEAWHLDYLAANMRPADRAEVFATGVHTDLRHALEQSVAFSTHCVVFMADDTPLCVMGVAPVSLASGVGSPWLLGSVAMTQHIRILLPFAAPYIRLMLRIYPSLENHVHAENRQAVRWLRASGFTVHPAEPWGLAGAQFHRFTMGA